MIEREPTLTGTVWDAVIAAAVEHACTSHDDPLPAWTQRPERFSREPWCRTNTEIGRGTELCNAPAAFIRHNTCVDVRSPDHRTGERHVWATNERTPTEAVLLSEADVQSAEEARRIHRTVYGKRPMAENADQYLIDRFVKRQGEGVPEPGAGPSSAHGAATERGKAKGGV